MLPKEERLRKKKEFDQVFKLKCSVATPDIVTYVKTKKDKLDTTLPKVGFIVTKKIHKKSSKRNKIKRRMREAYRIYKNETTDTIKSFSNIIFIARPSILGKNYLDIRDNILNCIKKTRKFINN